MSPAPADVRHPVVPAAVVPALVLATGLVTLLAVVVGDAAETLGAWWPTVGLATVALLLVPARRVALVAGALLAAVVLAGVLGGRPPGTAAVLAVVDVAEALLVALALRRATAGRLDRLADLGPLLASVAVGAVGGGLGVAAVLSSASGAGFGSTFTVAGLAHAAALLVLVPPALLDWRRPWSRRAAQAAPLGLVVGLVLVLAFSELTSGLTGLTLLVLPLPLMVAAAVRHDARVVVAVLVWSAALVSATVVASPNTFGAGAAGAAATTQVAQVYLVTLVLLVLPLALALRERDEAARRTRDSERTFRRAFTQAGLPVLLGRWDGATLRVSAASDACGGLLGREPGDLVGADVDQLVDAPGLREALQGDRLVDLRGWSGPLTLRHDPRRTVEAYAALLDVDGERGLLSLHLVDLTEHTSLQQRLTDERARSQAVMDTASSLIVITDVEGRVVTVNPETTRLTGWSADDLVGRPLWETMVAPRDRQAVEDAVTQVLPIPRSGELRLRTRGGTERTVVFTHAVHEGADDAPPTLVFSGTDVTEARESAEMVEHLLRSVTSIAFVGTDLDGAISLFSAGAERLFGVRADQAAGRQLGALLADAAEAGRPEGDLTRPRPGVPLARLVGSGAAEGSPRTQDWLALPHGRPPVRVSMTCNPVRSAAGVQHGYLFVARDVTDTRRNQEIMVSALRREREVVTRLQELDRAKDDFISTVSHELRTPMSSIIGSAEMLADGMAGDLQDGQQQLVDVVIRNGERLLGLADDLLTLATFDRGTPSQAVDAHLDLREVVRESLGAVRPHPVDDRLRWEVDLPASPVGVIGEAGHLERAVTNLLTNARKFTPAGGCVTVSLVTDASTATVTVSDTGRGIPESDLAHVFDRFYRAPEVQQHAIQGTGLGLSIVKQIIERHDGRVTVRSHHGEGTSVALTLPLAPPPEV